MDEPKTFFVAECKYAKDAREKRKQVRQEHLERIEKLVDEGALLLAGAYDDMSASLLLFDIGSEHGVRATIETDVYWKKRIWTAYSIKKLNVASIGSTF